jgi:3-isopropylmalate/(R)-2-methylmalate dehydratase large subunit
MTAELGAQTGLIASDETTNAFLKKTFETWESDADAPLLAHHRFDASDLAPQVAAPHSPANAKAASDFNQAIDLAYIGACTGAKLVDLRMAARILQGKKAKARLIVAPASARDQEIAAQEGIMKTLLDAGAELLPNTCGMCAGYGANQLAAGTVAISTTARNFRGRMGSPESQVYLASPYTVAASAVAGRICDPRELLP